MVSVANSTDPQKQMAFKPIAEVTSCAQKAATNSETAAFRKGEKLFSTKEPDSVFSTEHSIPGVTVNTTWKGKKKKAHHNYIRHTDEHIPQTPLG